jgi:hypothetical protein
VPIAAEVTHVTSVTIELWEGALGALVSALLGASLGSGIPLWWQARQRRLQRDGQLAAMSIEIRQARDLLPELPNLRNQGVNPMQSPPSFRLPISISENALPGLLGDRVFDESETSTLVKYISRVEEINRALDAATQAAQSNNQVAGIGHLWTVSNAVAALRAIVPNTDVSTIDAAERAASSHRRKRRLIKLQRGEV